MSEQSLGTGCKKHMDIKELSLAIDQLCEEKGLTKEDVQVTIEDALAAAYRKDFGDKKTQNIKVEFDLTTAKFKVFDVKEVVEDELKEKYEKIREEVEKLKEAGEEITPEIMEEITAKYTESTENTKTQKTQKKETEETKETDSEEVEEEKRFNPRTMISLSEAKEIKKSHKLGDEIITPLEVPAEFGRMAAQTAKQVIIQKIREAERNTIYDFYKDKVGELIVGTVQRVEGKIVLVDLGSATGIILPVDQIRSENYKSNARMKFYLKSVEQTNKGPEILLSRTHPEMLRKLFKLEVPEINSGAVVIKSIARDPGGRAKIAVQAKEEGLDPIGACIGQRGTRVQAIINELSGEKIDVIEWEEDLNKFITNALAPAKVESIEIVEHTDENSDDPQINADEGTDDETADKKISKTVKANVKDDQYSLAIGKGGQNVRLAAQLVGMRIDVVNLNPSETTDDDKQSTTDDKKEETEESKEKKNEETKETKETDDKDQDKQDKEKEEK